MTSTYSIKIKKLRKSVRLTQEKFAKSIGISRATIGQIEQGRQNPTLINLQLIIDNYKKALGVKTNESSINSELP